MVTKSKQTNELPVNMNIESLQKAHEFTLKKAQKYLQEAENAVGMMQSPAEVASFNLQLIKVLPVLRDMLLLPNKYADVKPAGTNVIVHKDMGDIDLDDLEDAQESDYPNEENALTVYEGEIE